MSDRGQQAAGDPADAIPTGNHYPKYHTKNPLARHLVAGFMDSFDALFARSRASDILEVGCGEGYLTTRMARAVRHNGAAKLRGIDIGADVVTDASRHAADQHLAIDFQCRSVYDLKPSEDGAGCSVAGPLRMHFLLPWRCVYTPTPRRLPVPRRRTLKRS